MPTLFNSTRYLSFPLLCKQKDNPTAAAEEDMDSALSAYNPVRSNTYKGIVLSENSLVKEQVTYTWYKK
jgi:hypothetical protein